MFVQFFYRWRAVLKDLYHKAVSSPKFQIHCSIFPSNAKEDSSFVSITSQLGKIFLLSTPIRMMFASLLELSTFLFILWLSFRLLFTLKSTLLNTQDGWGHGESFWLCTGLVSHSYLTGELYLYLSVCGSTLPLSTTVFMLQIVKPICFQPPCWFMWFYLKMPESQLFYYQHETSGTNYSLQKW